jgi:hypothetical protein
MKNLYFLLAVFLCGAGLFAETPANTIDWSLMTSGSWNDFSSTSGTFHNRLDFRLIFPAFGTPGNITLRGQILDRRPLNLEFDWGNPEKWVTHYQGGLYHKQTGSRLLYGALDEWGLSARIRNPWIRSPPFAENHKPLIADLKTTASSTKEDEVYLYLSTSFLDLSQNTKARGFVSAQTETDKLTPAFAGGIDLSLPNKSNLLFETFYTWATLPPKNAGTWFSNPPPLPEREFNLYAVGILFSNPMISIGSDFALSETFAWGSNIYANFGVSISTPVPWETGRIKKPLTISLAADGAGKRFVYRDGADHGTAFRTAAKIELKGSYNSLMRLGTTLRGPELGEGFTRSSTNFYYRLPYKTADSNFIRLTRVSISTDRNADNHLKIIDRLYGYIGLSLDLSGFGIKTPLGVYLNGSIRGITSSESSISPYPILFESRSFEDCSLYCELTYSPLKYQFKTRLGFSNNAKNNEVWDFSVSGAARFKQGRLSLKIASPRLPDLWNFTVSWRLEKS